MLLVVTLVMLLKKTWHFQFHLNKKLKNEHKQFVILMFEKIEKTGENFSLTYQIEKSDESFKNMIKADNYFQVRIDEKEKNSSQSKNNFSFTFGLSTPHKKSIVFR